MPEIRIVPDTNVLISSVFWRGKPHEVINRGLNGEYALITSKEILEEFLTKLINKFGFPQDQLSKLIETIFNDYHIVQKVSTLNVVRDPTDNKIIETAVDGGANYIVIGDPDLTDMKEFQGIKNLTPDKFLKLL